MEIISHTLADTEIELYPLSDLHTGDPLMDGKLFAEFVDHILDKPNRYVLCLGDLMNNNLTNSVGRPHDDIIPPCDQIKTVRRMLEPMKHRILAMVDGNHEYRSKKNADISITELLSEQLEIPYSEHEVLIALRMGRRENGKPHVFTIYGIHGSWGGKRPGNTINNLEDLSRGILADIYISGHSHKRAGTKAVIRVPDTRNNKVDERVQLYMSASSWLKYGGYGAKNSFRPQVRGTAPIRLFADGNKDMEGTL